MEADSPRAILMRPEVSGVGREGDFALFKIHRADRPRCRNDFRARMCARVRARTRARVVCACVRVRACARVRVRARERVAALCAVPF